MIDKLKDIFNSNKNILVSLSACVIIISILVIMSITTGFKPISNNYSNIVDKLDEANTNLTDAINKLSIDADLACTKLEESSKIIEEIETLLITIDNNEEVHACISETVDRTAELYDLSMYLIKHPNDLSDTGKLDKLSSCLNDCRSLYSELNDEHGLDVKFDSNTETFFENTINYVNTVITLNRDTDIKDSASKDFLLKLDDFTSTLKNMNQDLMPAVNKIREDKRKLDPLLDDISAKKKNLEDIKNKLNLLSIPEDCVHFYNSLKDTLVLYEKYISSFENAVLFEKSCSNYEESKNDIDKKYNNAVSKYTDMMNSYNNYNKLLEK